jgi:hypothetical protein
MVLEVVFNKSFKETPEENLIVSKELPSTKKNPANSMTVLRSLQTNFICN